MKSKNLAAEIVIAYFIYIFVALLKLLSWKWLFTSWEKSSGKVFYVSLKHKCWNLVKITQIRLERFETQTWNSFSFCNIMFAWKSIKSFFMENSDFNITLIFIFSLDRFNNTVKVPKYMLIRMTGTKRDLAHILVDKI